MPAPDYSDLELQFENAAHVLKIQEISYRYQNLKCGREMDAFETAD